MEQPEGKYTSIAAALAHPKKVEFLDLEDQGLTSIPEEVFEFPNLRFLNLSNNQLKDLPVEIANLPVTDLVLSHNEFMEFPKFLCAMRRLEKLDMSHNNIRTIPTEMSYLTEQLQFLNMKDNLMDEREELRLIRFLPNTDINFSLVKSYDPSRPKDRNWTHIEDKQPFNWQQWLSWMAVPATLIVLTLALWLVYKQFVPEPYDAQPRIEEVYPG